MRRAFAWVVGLMGAATGCCSLERNTTWQCVSDTDPRFVGAEDVAVLPGENLLLVSVRDVRRSGESTLRGEIYACDPTTGSLAAVSHGRPLTGDFRYPFRPHGISVWAGDADRNPRVFVINHRAPCQQCVEVFEWDRDEQKLTHLWTVLDHSGAMSRPNDLVAVSGTSFYVTNMTSCSTKPGMFLEGLARIGSGALLFCVNAADPHPRFQVVAEDLRMANGVEFSQTHNTLYVAEAGANRISCYSIDARDPHRVTGCTEIALPFTPDNLAREADGSMLVAGHTSGWDFIRNDTVGETSGSVIARVVPTPVTIEIMHVDPTGKTISAASSCVRSPLDPNRVFVGTVYTSVHVLEPSSQP